MCLCICRWLYSFLINGLVGSASIPPASQLLASTPTANASGPSTPRPAKSGQESHCAAGFPQCLSFDDEGGFYLLMTVNLDAIVTFAVPIYDARKENRFSFRLKDLRDISKLPRFRNGLDDPAAEKYVAAVGYTVATYAYGGSQSRMSGLPAVALNIMFAIILGRVAQS